MRMEKNGSLFKTNVETMSISQNLKGHLKKKEVRSLRPLQKIVIEKIWIKIRNEMHA